MAGLSQELDQHVLQARQTGYRKTTGFGPICGSIVRSENPLDRPALESALDKFQPLPREALFLGIASDGSPLLLNLFDPSAGPILLVGDSGVGKTTFLRNIAWSVNVLHAPRKVQYGILTANPEGWWHMAHYPTCIAVFNLMNQEATAYLSSLQAWSIANRVRKQAVLVLLDGLEMIESALPQARRLMRWVPKNGPASLVWPIVTLNAELLPEVQDWLGVFQTHIFGHTTQGCAFLGYQDEEPHINALQGQGHFLLRNGNHWLEFHTLNPGWRYY